MMFLLKFLGVMEGTLSAVLNATVSKHISDCL